VCGCLKSRKKFTKTHIFGVEGHSRSSILVPPASASAVLVMIHSKSVSICNRSRARLVDNSRNCTFSTFSRGYPNLMRSYGGLVEPRGRTLHHKKTTETIQSVATEVEVETLGVFNASARHLLADLGRRISVNTGEARETSYLFQWISVLVLRFNAVFVAWQFAGRWLHGLTIVPTFVLLGQF